LEKLLLSEEGIFPVTKDENGKILAKSPNTGMSVPGTVQGEGRLAGTPSLFIRLAGCNLRCIWDKGNGDFSICDTPHSVFGNFLSVHYSVEKIVSTVKYNIENITHIVITGGEPMLQAKPLSVLCSRLKREFGVHITLETNGTVFDEELATHIDLFSVSPKLSGTNPLPEKLKTFGLKETEIHRSHDTRRINIVNLQSLINLSKKHGKSIQLKFVVTKPSDSEEIKTDFLDKLDGWSKDDIFIMPLGATKEELRQFTPVALEMAVRNGWRFSPRMHIELFDENKGV